MLQCYPEEPVPDLGHVGSNTRRERRSRIGQQKVMATEREMDMSVSLSSVTEGLSYYTQLGKSIDGKSITCRDAFF